MRRICFFIFAFFLAGSIMPVLAQEDVDKEMIYVGTYSQRGSKGIYVFEFDRDQVNLDPVQTVPGGKHPSFLAVHPNGRYLYAVYEGDGIVAAFKITPSGELGRINQQSSGGSGPCHVSVDPLGEFVYASNRGHNSLAIFAIDGTTGKLHPHGFTSTRGERPRNFLIDKQGMFVFVANRNSDNVVVFRRNARTGELEYTGEEVQVPAAVCVQQLQ